MSNDQEFRDRVLALKREGRTVGDAYNEAMISFVAPKYQQDMRDLFADIELRLQQFVSAAREKQQ